MLSAPACMACGHCPAILLHQSADARGLPYVLADSSVATAAVVQREGFVSGAQKIVDSNADLAVKKSEAAQRQQNAAIATDVAVRQQQVQDFILNPLSPAHCAQLHAPVMPLHVLVWVRRKHCKVCKMCTVLTCPHSFDRPAEKHASWQEPLSAFDQGRSRLTKGPHSLTTADTSDVDAAPAGGAGDGAGQEGGPAADGGAACNAAGRGQRRR